MPLTLGHFRAAFKADHKHKFAITGTGFVLNPPPRVVLVTGNPDYSWGTAEVVVGESSDTLLMIRSKLTKNHHKPTHGMGNLTVTVTNNGGSGQSQTATLTPDAITQVNYDDSAET